jgi:hypothetical protein
MKGIKMKTYELLDDEGRIEGRYWNCYCGCTVETYGAQDVSCDECGRLFNGFGQELNPVSQWDEKGEY